MNVYAKSNYDGAGIYDCPQCGLVIDRDVNAAINILSLGLQALGVSP